MAVGILDKVTVTIQVLLDEFENKDAIIVRNLKVWTPEEKSIWRKVAKPKTVIIDNGK